MDHLLSMEIRTLTQYSLFGFEGAFLQLYMSGDDGGGDTPVPIPNTAVKPSSADGTCPEGDRESRTLPGGCKCYTQIEGKQKRAV